MSVTASTIAQTTSGLDRLLADVKYRLGVFLANERIVLDAKTRLNALLDAGLPAVKSQATALLAKADALLKIQRDAETQAQNLITEAGGLKTKVETDAFYSFLKTSMLNWGLRQYEIVADLIKKVTGYISMGGSLATRMLKQNTDVKTLTNEVAATERAAAGQGTLPAIKGLVESAIQPLGKAFGSATLPLGIGLGAAALAYIFFLSPKRR